MFTRLRLFSLPTQLAVGSLIAVVLIFSILISVINTLFKDQLDDVVTSHQLTEVALLAHELSSQYTMINETLARSANYVDEELGGSLKKQGGTWSWGNTALAQAKSQLGRIKESINAELIIIKSDAGSSNIIASTSQNFSGTMKVLNHGARYAGKWYVGNHHYIVHYQPITNHPELTFAIAVPYDRILQDMGESLNSIKIGKRGYVYVTNTGDEKGQLLIHPSEAVVGKNVFDLFPTAKSAFESIYQQDSGVTRYTIQVAGQDNTAEESKVIFKHVDGWDWVVAIKTYSSEYNEELMYVLYFIMGICVIAVVVLFSVLWLHIKASLNPLRDITKGVREIGRGNLAYRFKDDVSEASENETHQLQLSVQTMRDGLISLIEKVQSSSDQLVQTAQSISIANDHLIESANTSSNSCAQVASAIEQMSASIEEVASNSTSVSEESMSVNNVTEEGYRATKQVEETVASLSSSFEHAAKTIQEVESSTENIGNVVNVINEIAEQTNLLALNAAIEAARAGEQGRGFAVVADEVRVLAQRTQQSTEEIKQVVERLQKNSRSAVDTMQQGRDQVENSVKQATNAGDILSRIHDSMGLVSQGIASVAASTEEQSVAATQIRGNTEELHAVSMSTYEDARNSQSESIKINQLADALKQDLTRFTL